MNKAIAASVMILGLVACGGGGDGKSFLVGKCVEEGESKEACNCQVDALEEALGSENIDKMVALAKSEDEAGAQKLMTEIMAEDPTKVLSMATAMGACAQ